MKKVIFVYMLLLWSLSVFGQAEDSVKHFSPRYGFNLGINYSQVIANQGLPTNASISNGIGFRLGLVGEYSISKNISFSPKAEVSLNQGKVLFSSPVDSKTTYKVMSTSLELMTHFIFRKKNQQLSPYFMLGPNVKIPLAKNANNTTSFSTGIDFALDLGIGMEKAFPVLNFSPELRYSLGLQNVNTNSAIQSLKFHSMSLIFNFM